MIEFIESLNLFSYLLGVIISFGMAYQQTMNFNNKIGSPELIFNQKCYIIIIGYLSWLGLACTLLIFIVDPDSRYTKNDY